jgi:hypothetical protein
MRHLLQQLPTCLPPEFLPTAATLLIAAEQSPAAIRGYPLIQDVETFLRALAFRRDLHQAFPAPQNDGSH